MKLNDEDIAEAWFKPEGEQLGLVFRVPQLRFDVEDLSQLLTVEDLLSVAGLQNEEVESWRFRDEFHLSDSGTNLELKRLLPSPPSGETHLIVRVRLKSPTQDVSQEVWQALDAAWKTILGLEASIDALRLSMNGLQGDMDAAFRKGLNVEEKVHALQSDVAQWNKGKNRIHYGLPKVREFIHRATWAVAVPERKRLEEFIKNHIEPRIPFPELNEVREQLVHLQKDRQVLFSVGNAVNQECRGILADVQRAVSTLQRNASDLARKKRSVGRDKRKHL